jgi:hypothetical protein
MPATSAERHVIFATLVCDVLGLTHVLRTIAGRVFAGGRSWWRLLLLSTTFALGLLSLILLHRKFLRGGPQQPVWRGMWWCECVVRTAVLSALIAYGDRSTLPRQTVFALWEALALSAVITVCRVWVFIRGFTMVELNEGQRTVLGAQALVFVPLFVSAVAFHLTEGFPFDTAWNFVNHTALTVGFGDIRVQSVAGKVILVTFGNVVLAFVAFLLVALRDVIPVARSRRAVSSLAAGFVAYWLLGALAFSLIEEWSFLNSTYFTWASLTTIGFGDFHPTTAAGSEFWLMYTYVAVCLYSLILAAASQAIRRRNVPDPFATGAAAAPSSGNDQATP